MGDKVCWLLINVQSPYECTYGPPQVAGIDAGGRSFKLTAVGMAVRRRDIPTLAAQVDAEQKAKGHGQEAVSAAGACAQMRAALRPGGQAGFAAAVLASQSPKLSKGGSDDAATDACCDWLQTGHSICGAIESPSRVGAAGGARRATRPSHPAPRLPRRMARRPGATGAMPHASCAA